MVSIRKKEIVMKSKVLEKEDREKAQFGNLENALTPMEKRSARARFLRQKNRDRTLNRRAR